MALVDERTLWAFGFRNILEYWADDSCVDGCWPASRTCAATATDTVFHVKGREPEGCGQ